MDYARLRGDAEARRQVGKDACAQVFGELLDLGLLGRDVLPQLSGLGGLFVVLRPVEILFVRLDFGRQGQAAALWRVGSAGMAGLHFLSRLRDGEALGQVRGVVGSAEPLEGVKLGFQGGFLVFQGLDAGV